MTQSVELNRPYDRFVPMVQVRVTDRKSQQVVCQGMLYGCRLVDGEQVAVVNVAGVGNQSYQLSRHDITDADTI